MTPRTVAALGGLLGTIGLGCGAGSPSGGLLTYIYGQGGSANVDNGTIVEADLGTGRTTALLTFPYGGADVLGELRFDGTTAYYADQTVAATNQWVATIRSIGLGGGTPTTLLTGLYTIDAIAVDGDSLYFSDYATGPNFDSSTGVSFIGKAPLGGGSFVKLVDDIPGRAEAVAVGGGFVYWNDTSAGTIARVPTAGGDPAVVATVQEVLYAPSLAADDSGVYWVSDGSAFANCDFSDGSIQSLPTGSANPVAIASGLENPTTIVVSAGSVYFTMLGPEDCSNPPDYPPAGAVIQVPEQGGAAVRLASGLNTPFDLFVRGGVVAFTTTSNDATAVHAVSKSP